MRKTNAHCLADLIRIGDKSKALQSVGVNPAASGEGKHTHFKTSKKS
jgi:hypothetical protein